MNRREFQAYLVGAIATGAFGLANASSVKDPATHHIYRYRLRYVRGNRDTFWLWMRVSDLNDVDADLPVTLVLATGDPSLDSVVTKTYVSRALESHILRDKITISAARWQLGSPLYAALRIGASQTPSKIWRITKA